SVFELSQSISGGKFLSLRELNQILLLEKGTGFEKYNKGNDSLRIIPVVIYSRPITRLARYKKKNRHVK
ncbi:hypothetical protein ACTGXY_11580, partial [Streptococcus suis]